jgi:hypothetical protein
MRAIYLISALGFLLSTIVCGPSLNHRSRIQTCQYQAVLASFGRKRATFQDTGVELDYDYFLAVKRPKHDIVWAKIVAGMIQGIKMILSSFHLLETFITKIGGVTRL